MRRFLQFGIGSLRAFLKGSWVFYVWLALLLVLAAIGAVGYVRQLSNGLVMTNMRDEISWAFYIGNFTFLVGVAAAAVVLVIPAYIYDWKPIKEIAVFGELLAIAAIIMCFGFVFVDIGRPDRFWHLLPGVGIWNAPSSLLAWDVLVLTSYFLLNFVVATHIVYRTFMGKHYNKKFAVPLILFSIPLAVSIHTVTAFIYSGMVGRPFWSTALLAPRFLASAFCSGPAIMLLALSFLKKYADFKVTEEAIAKIAELMAFAMGINLFFLGCEVFKEFYFPTEHAVHAQFAWFGLHGHASVMPYSWASLVLSVVAFLLFLFPRTRTNPVFRSIGAFAILGGVYIEKGLTLVIPGFTPTTLGQIYDYKPSSTELMVGAGLFGVGFLAFTFMVKVANAIMAGQLRYTANTRTPNTPAKDVA